MVQANCHFEKFNQKEVMIDIKQIMSIIPHRYPFLLVDRVEALEKGKSIIAKKNVTINEPHFQGHFPGNPVMPGVLIVESMAQSAAILVAQTLNLDSSAEVLFLSIDNVKFRKIVAPGDSLTIYVEIMQNKGDVWKCQAKANVGDDLVCEGVLTALVK